MAITTEVLMLQATLDAQVAAITDQQTRTLTAAWVVAWAEVSADLRDTLAELLAGATKPRLTRAMLLRSVRLRSVLAQIADHLDTLAASSGVTITSDLKKVVQDAVHAQREILSG